MSDNRDEKPKSDRSTSSWFGKRSSGVVVVMEAAEGGEGGTQALHALAASPLTTYPRKDGTWFPQDRLPMQNLYFPYSAKVGEILFFFSCLHQFSPSEATSYGRGGG